MKLRKIVINISIIIFLAIIWAVEEVYAGGWLKNINMVIAGLWLSFFAVVIILIGRSVVPVLGSIILLGISAALIKSLLSRFYLEGPIIALLLESLAGELMILLFKQRRLGFLLTGALVFCITAFHAFILSGDLIDTAYFETFKAGFFTMLHLKTMPISLLIFVYALGHILIGLSAGLAAWHISTKVINRKVK